MTDTANTGPLEGSLPTKNSFASTGLPAAHVHFPEAPQQRESALPRPHHGMEHLSWQRFAQCTPGQAFMLDAGELD